MASLLKSGNIKTYLYLALVVILGLVWRGSEAVSAKLATLPVKEAPRVNTQEVQLSAKSFYPVWIKQAAAMSAEQAADVDALFKKQEEAKPVEPVVVKPVEPDYGEILRYKVELSGVADNGAFINGQFYKTGSQMPELMIVTMSGTPLTPVLAGVQKDSVTILLGKRSIIVAAKNE